MYINKDVVVWKINVPVTMVVTNEECSVQFL